MRKTVSVFELRQTANYRLRTGDDTPEFRAGICSLLEQALHTSGNYRGFRYIAAADVENGDAVAIGITRDDNGDPVFPDETRRQYL